MSKELTEFDPKNLVQRLSDKIKESFVGLIPDEKWEEMVKKEVDAFFTEETKLLVLDERKENPNDYWNRKTVKQIKLGEGVTPFRAIIWNLCIEETYKAVEDEMFTEYFKNSWTDGKRDMTPKIKEIIKESIPYAITRYFEQVAMNSASMIEDQFNRIPQQY